MKTNKDRSATDAGPVPHCPICSGPSHYDFSGRDLMFGLHQPHDYFRCDHCGCLFQHPTPSADAIASFYPPHYEIYDEHKRTRPLSWLKRTVLACRYGYGHLATRGYERLLGRLAAPFFSLDTPTFVRGGTVLDVGTGNGRFLSRMRALGWAVQGVELSEDGVRACRNEQLPVHHGDLASANFPDERFELITARHVIEHIPDPAAFIAEVARVLKPSGILMIETPNSAALGCSLFTMNWYANDVPRHLVLFSPENLDLLLHGAGLQLSRRRLVTTPKVFLNSLDYIFQNQGRPSKTMRGRRFLARAYVWLATRIERGDTIIAEYRKLAARPVSPTSALAGGE